MSGQRWMLPPEVPKYPVTISYRDTIVSIGSCFSEHIARHMLAHKWKVCINPFGILYNPVSVCRALHRIATAQLYEVSELVSDGELWHSWDHHGRFSHPDPDEVVRRINTEIERAHRYLKEARWLFVTLGTAYVFQLVSSGAVVANCHKFPSRYFRRRRLRVSECVDTLSEALQAVRRLNPEVQVLLTISPVRHVRDGLIANTRSKSVLHLAVEEVAERNEGVYYFPAYELLIDVLRDYRFYESDRVHPTREAIEYIWQQMHDHLLDEPTREVYAEVRKIRMALEHRPRYPDTASHRRFIASLLRQMELVERKWGIDFSEEKALYNVHQVDAEGKGGAK